MNRTPCRPTILLPFTLLNAITSMDVTIVSPRMRYALTKSFVAVVGSAVAPFKSVSLTMAKRSATTFESDMSEASSVAAAFDTPLTHSSWTRILSGVSSGRTEKSCKVQDGRSAGVGEPTRRIDGQPQRAKLEARTDGFLAASANSEAYLGVYS